MSYEVQIWAPTTPTPGVPPKGVELAASPAPASLDTPHIFPVTDLSCARVLSVPHIATPTGWIEMICIEAVRCRGSATAETRRAKRRVLPPSLPASGCCRTAGQLSVLMIHSFGHIRQSYGDIRVIWAFNTVVWVQGIGDHRNETRETQEELLVEMVFTL